jgi:hypothetical protein
MEVPNTYVAANHNYLGQLHSDAWPDRILRDGRQSGGEFRLEIMGTAREEVHCRPPNTSTVSFYNNISFPR